jgi:ABC-2 type transport system permease protein
MDPQPELTKSEIQNIMNEVHSVISNFKISLIFHFIFYFLGGYILYGSLFAAVGAMIDNESDAPQLSIIIILPVMIPVLFLGNLIQNPSGGLAVFMSIFPLFSSITMMIRLAATDVPWIQLVLSQLFLILGVIGLGWLSARIFRVGILLYGKKYSLKDAFKWIFSKN